MQSIEQDYEVLVYPSALFPGIPPPGTAAQHLWIAPLNNTLALEERDVLSQQVQL
ncbi:hypothetical protein [Pseudoteredinibacter isoporae]|uniref:hypothetical protein n=1 Tax=Pseudoteredinibacter isoporae TaxID=570281 RepID=UPI001C872ACD|nr:hypothetical protein [Pseudoteredinibacter isoporae]